MTPGPRVRPGLRLRLTVGGAVLAAGVFAAGGLVLFSVYQQSLVGDQERPLAGTAAEVLADVKRSDPPVPIPMPVAEGVPRLQVLDAAGRVVTGDPDSAYQPPMLIPPPGTDRQALVVTDPWYLPAHRVYVLAISGMTPAGRRTVVIAGSIDPAYARAREAALLAGYAGAGALVVVTALLWLLTGRALRPVEQMRTQVTAITASGDLSRRVPRPSRQDELGRLATTLNDMLRVLEASDRQQRQFIADASHELRTPLAGITAYLEVADAHPGAIEHDALVRRMLSAHRHLTDLVNDLLTLASIDAGAPNRHRPVDLTAVVRDCTTDLVTPRVRLTTSVHGEATVLGNATQLHRVVANLIDNAIRHAREAVTLKLSTSDTEAILTVADDGPGVPADRQDEIWHRFVRLDNDRGRPQGGTGLGLALVKEIVTAHGGHAAVRNSQPGAVFTIALPLTRSTIG